jgi:pimeloyl-ACP methyl ester carboxylesterase
MQEITTVDDTAHSTPRAVPRLRNVLLFTAIVLFAIPLLVTLHSKEKTMHSLGENRFTISRDGTRIAFTKVGSGPPVVLVDGAFCYRELGPAPELAPLLAQHFTVFVYDRRGRGESGDTPPYAIEREIDDLRAVVDEAGGTADVVGISSGAALGLQAVASGVKVKKLVLYEPPYVTNGDRPKPQEDPKIHIQQLVSAGDRAGVVKFFLADVIGVPRAIVFAMPLFMRSNWKRMEQVAYTLPYDLTISDDRSVLKERSASISVPTLVLGGEKSPTMLRDAVSALAKALPNARSQLLAGQDHNLSAPIVAPLVVDFFNQR